MFNVKKKTWHFKIDNKVLNRKKAIFIKSTVNHDRSTLKQIICQVNIRFKNQ